MTSYDDANIGLTSEIISCDEVDITASDLLVHLIRIIAFVPLVTTTNKV